MMATAPRPQPLARQPVSPAQRKALLAAWLALPQYAERDRAWRRSPRELPDGKPAEPSYVEHQPPALTRFALGEHSLVVAQAGDELPCWPFQGALWAVWQVTGDDAAPRLTLVHAGRVPQRELDVKSVFLVAGEPLLLLEWRRGGGAFFVRDGRLARDPALETSFGADEYLCKK
jgi:hypothetical protein